MIAYPVTDCPDHPQSALTMPSGLAFCYACGRMVEADVITRTLVTAEAPDDLKAEARRAWNGSRTIREFAAACQPGTTQLTTGVAR